MWTCEKQAWSQEQEGKGMSGIKLEDVTDPIL